MTEHQIGKQNARPWEKRDFQRATPSITYCSKQRLHLPRHPNHIYYQEVIHAGCLSTEEIMRSKAFSFKPRGDSSQVFTHCIKPEVSQDKKTVVSLLGLILHQMKPMIASPKTSQMMLRVST